MNILAVYAHPGAKSFNRELLDVVTEVAEAKGHGLQVRDLYALGFQPALTEGDFESFNRGITPDDVKAEQEAVTRADVIVIVHPVWWFGPPAILKGWIDRVFSYGFAYGHDSRGIKPLLAGKKAVIVNTAGGAEAAGYDDTGFKDAIAKLNDIGICRFVGLEVILRRMFFEVPAASESSRLEMRERLRTDLQKIL